MNTPTSQSSEPVVIRWYRHEGLEDTGGGDDFGTSVEPEGLYVHVLQPNEEPPDPYKGADEMTRSALGEGIEVVPGCARFKNPLVVDYGTSTQDGDSWKHRLSAKYRDLCGQPLSRAIQDAGYDGIITVQGGCYAEAVIFESARLVR